MEKDNQAAAVLPGTPLEVSPAQGNSRVDTFDSSPAYPETQRFIEALKDEDADVRRRAAKVLGDIGDAKAVPALIEALKDEDKYIGGEAARALGRIGDAKAVPALIEALKDVEGTVRDYAAFALGTPTLFEALRSREDGHSHAKAALDLIRVALESSDRLTDQQKRTAAYALGQSGDAASAPLLIEMLADQDALVRAAAADALVLFGEPAVPALQKAMDRADAPAREYTEAILDRLQRS